MTSEDLEARTDALLKRAENTTLDPGESALVLLRAEINLVGAILMAKLEQIQRDQL